MSANNQFEVIPTGAALGADIVGLDLTQEIDGDVFKKVTAAWDQHLVLRFRNQNLTEDQFVRFSQYFGALDKAPTRPVNGAYHPTREEIAVISNIVKEGVAIGGLGNSELVWHQDMTYKDLPPKASILYGLTTPATGGDTHFYNLNRAYETLARRVAQRRARSRGARVDVWFFSLGGGARKRRRRAQVAARVHRGGHRRRETFQGNERGRVVDGECFRMFRG